MRREDRRIARPHPFLLALIALCTGCSYFGWTQQDGGGEPGIVLLERKASPDIQGFNVYRVDPETGAEMKVNSRLVEPASNITDEDGLVTYRVIDRGVIAGEEYYYIFEEVGQDGETTRWETYQKKVAQPIGDS